MGFTLIALFGVIQGIALENATSAPLARTRIRLEKVDGNQRRTLSSAVTGNIGQFFFTAVPEGLYVVTATRPAYSTTIFKTKADDLRSGVLTVRNDADVFAEIRMKKLGAITGRVLDDNRVGIQGVRVIAYPARIPLRMAADGKTDDRGAYRIYGLQPGRYYIRTDAQPIDDGPAILPSFYPHGTQAREARTVEVAVDRETTDIDIRPVEGQLSKITLTLGCPASATVVLSSDTGRRQNSVPCSVATELPNVPPGDYEILAYAPKLAAYTSLHVERDARVGLDLKELPAIRMVSRRDRDSSTVIGRRRDLAGEGESVVLSDPVTPVLPGIWEFSANVPGNRHLVRITDYRMRARPLPSTEWFPFEIETASQHYLDVELSDGASTLVGRVMSRGEVVNSAPVHLYPLTPETRQQMAGNRLAFTDAEGRYRFDGLAPGTYLVGSVFDVIEVNEDSLRNLGAQEITVEGRQNAVRDLTLPENGSQ